ncbi:MAG: hypothetical protein ACI8RD_004572 [Bacillariaceae sp.]|jgi:hypothetical protein
MITTRLNVRAVLNGHLELRVVKLAQLLRLFNKEPTTNPITTKGGDIGRTNVVHILVWLRLKTRRVISLTK